MTTNVKLQALEISKEMADVTEKAKKLTIMKMIEDMLFETILTKVGAKVRQTSLRLGLNDDEINFDIDIAWWDESKSHYDFMSDLTLCYSKYEGLRINHGTGGYFTSEDIYMMKRCELLGLIAANYDLLKENFIKIHDEALEWRNAAIDCRTLKIEIEDVKNAEANKAIEDVNNSLKVGQKLQYSMTQEIHLGNRVMGNRVFKNYDTWEILKLTKMYAYIKNITSKTPEEKVKRTLLARVINENDILIVGE